MITFDKKTIEQLLKLYDSRKIGLEGNIAKIIATEDEEFKKYLETCIENDNENRRKRLNITKQVQAQNTQLIKAKEENDRITEELKIALGQAEESKKLAESDLDLLQKRTQFELIGLIVKIALSIIIGVGVITTSIYIYIITIGGDSTIIESSWANMFGILLTNSFSIIGTIMGVKYASDKIDKK
jgi:NAD kinase